MALLLETFQDKDVFWPSRKSLPKKITIGYEWLDVKCKREKLTDPMKLVFFSWSAKQSDTPQDSA